MEKLKDIYYNPKYGFPDAKKLHGIVGKEYSLKEIKAFIAEQEVNQIHKQDKTHKIYAPIVGGEGWFQTDLTFYEQYKNNNRGYYIILTCIDIISRKAYARALKNKTEDNVIEAFKGIIKEAGNMKVVGFDKGSEFQTKFKNMLKDNVIDYYTSDTGDKHKMAMVERFNLTLRNRLEKYMTAYKTNKWVDVLDDIVYSYNDTIHSSTGEKPNEVGDEEIKNILVDNLERVKEFRSNVERFSIGDKVRLKKHKGLLEKKSGEQYNHGLYTITKINPFSYRITNDRGDLLVQKIKHDDLQKVGGLQTFEPIKPMDREKEVKKYKVEKDLKKEGIKKENIVAVSRRAKTIDGLDLGNIIEGKKTRHNSKIKTINNSS